MLCYSSVIWNLYRNDKEAVPLADSSHCLLSKMEAGLTCWVSPWCTSSPGSVPAVPQWSQFWTSPSDSSSLLSSSHSAQHGGNHKRSWRALSIISTSLRMREVQEWKNLPQKSPVKLVAQTMTTLCLPINEAALALPTLYPPMSFISSLAHDITYY